MIERSGVELDELHVADLSLGAVDHRYSVAGGDQGVGGCRVTCADTAGGHDGHLGQERVNAVVLFVENVGAIAGDVGGAAGDNLSEMVGSDDLDGKPVLEDVDVGVIAHLFHQSALNLGTGVVGVVKDSELGVATLAVEVIGTIVIAVKLHTVLDEKADPVGRVAHDLLHSFRVRQPVTGDHRVVYMFIEVVDLEIGDAGDATLGESRVGLVERRLAHYGDAAIVGHFEREAHPGDAGADHKEIIFLNHRYQN